MWYDLFVSHAKTSRLTRYTIRLGARGRLVLPAAVRKELGLDEGDRLILTVEAPEQLGLTSARVAAASAKGLLRRVAGDRSLADELIAERRQEARGE